MEIEELALRVKAASGPDGELDKAINNLINPPRVAAADEDQPPPGFGSGFLSGAYWGTEYTGSIDAAITLVPDGWHVSQLDEDWRDGTWRARVCQRPTEGQRRAYDEGRVIGSNDAGSTAATPALALCAAALRALASKDPR